MRRLHVVADGTHRIRVLLDGREIPTRLIDVRLGLGLIPDVDLELLLPEVEIRAEGARVFVHAPDIRFVCAHCGHEAMQAEVRTIPPKE